MAEVFDPFSDFNSGKTEVAPAKDQSSFEERYPEYRQQPAKAAPDKAVPATPEQKVADNKKYEDMPWTDVGVEALKSAPSSAYNVGAGVVQAAMHPVDTLTTVAKTAEGFNNKLDRWTKDNLGFTIPGGPKDNTNEPYADALIGDYKDRYFSGIGGLKKTIATDPVGMGLDVGSLAVPAARVATVAKLGPLARAAKVASLADPVTGALKTAKAIAKKPISLAADLGEGIQRFYLAAHSGEPMEVFRIAQQAGKLGGDELKDFKRAARGEVPDTEIVENAEGAFDRLERQAMDDWANAMKNSGRNTTPLHPQLIAQSTADFQKLLNSSSMPKALKAEGQDIIDAVRTAHSNGNLNITQLDRLRRDINLYPKLPGDLSHHVGQIVKSIKETIKQVDPTYEQTLSKYGEWKDLARDLKSGLGSGNAKIGQIQFMTKLNKALRSKQGKDLLEKLSATPEGRTLIYKLAGNQVKSIFPEMGWTNLTNIPAAALATFVHPAHIPFAVAGALSTSPKIAGWGAQTAGTLRRHVGNAVKSASKLPDAKYYPAVPVGANTLKRAEELREEDDGVLRLPITRARGTPEASGGRVGGYKSGGRVSSHEQIADQLVAAAERAKKARGQTTKVLLNTPDDMVAKALQVANRSI
jgi:hypothetical protein